MYIKINKRFDKLQFSVIESYRADGKVKHRTLSYLATISEGDFKNVHRLERFWKNCDEKLESFSEDDRTHLTARLEAIVPRPTEEIAEQARKEELERMKEFAAYMNSRHTNPSLPPQKTLTGIALAHTRQNSGKT